MNRTPIASLLLVAGMIGCAESKPPAASPATSTGALEPPPAPPAPTENAAVAATAETSAPPAPAPPEPAPAEKPLLDVEARGCFAWSLTEKRVACVESISSIAKGCHDSLVLFGQGATKRYKLVDVKPQCLEAPKATLDEAVRSEVDAALTKSYARLAGEAHDLAPGEKFDTGSGNVAFQRTKKKTVSIPNAGAWDVFADEVTISCGARKQRVLALTVENVTEPKVRIVETGTSWLVVSYAGSWGIEGDIGSRIDVALVDRASCAVRRP